MPYDEKLANRIRDVLKGKPRIAEKRMFGGIAFMHRDYMFVGIANRQLMVRVGVDAYEAALRSKYVHPMDFTGRPLKGYVYVDSEAIRTTGALSKWIEAGISFVKTLPTKKRPSKKKPSKKTKVAKR